MTKLRLLSKKAILVLAVLSLSGLYSCNKEELIGDPNESNDPQNINYKLNNIPIEKVASSSMLKDKAGNYIYNYPLLSSNPDDFDDEKINNLLFKLTEATSDLIKDIGFNRMIINMARNSETSSANLLDLQTLAPHYFHAIDNKLNSLYGLSLQQIADDLTHRPIAPNPDYPETGTLERYVPAIFIPNLDQVDEALQPIISPNLVVDGSIDESLEDNVIGWYFENEQDQFIKETLIDEASSMLTTNPLFFIDNAITTLKVNSNNQAAPFYGIDSCIYTDSTGLIRQGNNTSNQLASTKSFSSREHRIKGSSYRYESWTGGKSEFAIEAYRIEPNGTHHWIYNSSGYKGISKISKNHVSGSVMQWNWSHHASDWLPRYNSWSFPSVQSGVNYVYWNTYERDWNRSPKSLGNVTRNGTTLYYSGRMRYSSEWYAWIPSTLHIHNTQFTWIDYYWAHWNNSWKSDFRIWKVFI